jgi:AhpD family alkylhydroperoxidase
MSEQKSRADKFIESLGEDVNSAFKRLAHQIMKDGALSAKDKALIAIACAVAVKCEHCVQRHKSIALSMGASKEELLEAAAVAGLVRMGSGFNAAYSLLDDANPEVA